MRNLQDDIIKYKKGELSPMEMHALEKKALNDPFLAEALEGLENISSKDLIGDVAEINQQIVQERKTVWFTPLRLAAGMILVLASVFLVYEFMPKREQIALQTEKKNQPTPAPKTKPKQPEQEESKENNISSKASQGEVNKLASKAKEPGLADVEKEKMKTDDQLIVAENSKPKIEAQPIMVIEKENTGHEKKPEEAKAEVQQNGPVSIAVVPAKEIQADQDLNMESKATGREKKTKYKSETLNGAGMAMKAPVTIKPISGKVISAEDGMPIPGVNVVIEGTTTGAITDANGNFTVQTSGENQKLVFSFIGLQTQEVNVDGKDKVDVELKTDLTQLNEVVVTGLGKAKEEDEEPVIHLANPKGGKRAYNKYLETNVKYPEEALQNNIKGKVRVEFAVHSDGSIDQYKVIKSLGYGCDEEVIRLIKEGPKWAPTTENGRPVESTIRVGVRFDPAKSRK